MWSFVTLDLFVSNVSSGKSSIVKGVSSKIWHVMYVDHVFNCVEELQVGLLEHILQEFAINEIVHPFKDCDSASFIQMQALTSSPT